MMISGTFPQAARRADATLEWAPLPWSSARYKETGSMVPDDGWDTLRSMITGWSTKFKRSEVSDHEL